MEAFKGVIIAMNSCYNEDGEVCPDTVKKLSRHYAKAGVKGLYVGGSTGEGMLQTLEERKQTAVAAMEAAGASLKVIVHVGANSTRDSIELALHAESIGAHALSAVPSIYYRLSSDAVEKHWQAIIDSTSLPFIIYHIPQTTGFHLTPLLLKKMALQEKVIGVKISADSVYLLQQFKQAGGEQFLVFNGPDEQYLAGRSMGADGGIGGTYGVMPELFLKIENCFIHGNMEEARLWQNRINDIIAELLEYPSLYAACKAILTLRGFNCGQPRMPIPALQETDWERIHLLNEKILLYIQQSKA